MAYRELELSLLSAQDLKYVNLITRMDVYAVVSISGDPLTRQCTEPDTYGGRNPCWDATFRFAVPPTAAAAAGASLHVLLRAERFLGDRDVGEVVIPLADILASASGPGPQAPQVASYQVRKLHRWEPRGVLHVSYRLGPVVAPVVERTGGAPPDKPAPVSFNAYPPMGLPRQPSHHHPSAVAHEPAPPAPGPPAVRVVTEHDEKKKSPVMAYPVPVPVGVPQQASPPPAKLDAYRPPASPPPPRPAAVHADRHEAAARAPTRAPAPAPAPAPTPPPTNNNGLGQSGPTHVYMGPHTQIIFSGGAPTTTAGLPTWTTSPSPAGKKGDGNWALLPHDNYASWRPSMVSQSQKIVELEHQQAGRGSSPVTAAAASHSHRLAASPFSSRCSSFLSSPSPSRLSPYSSAHPSPSSPSPSRLSPYSSAHPSPSSSAHSSTRSPYSSYSAHPSTTTSPHPPHRSPTAIDTATSPHPPNRSPTAIDAAEFTHGSNKIFRSTSRGAAVASPLPSSSPLVPNHSSVVH